MTPKEMLAGIALLLAALSLFPGVTQGLVSVSCILLAIDLLIR